MNIAVIDYGAIPDVRDPDALLDRFPSLTAWCESLLGCGAARVTVAQRFDQRARVVRRGVEYEFRRSLSELHTVVRNARPDVAHVNGLRFPLQTWLLRRAMPAVAIVVQDHASGDPSPRLRRGGSSVRRAVWRRGLGAADAFLFTAAEQADAWKEAGLIGRDQSVFGVLEASTSLKALPRAQARAATGMRGDGAVLWVGRLNRNKDPLTVLSGFEMAARTVPSAHLTMIYGEDELLRDVRGRIEASDVLRARVTLVGSVPHDTMAAYFSAADVFVLGSHHEGSGFALLEACACGVLPVVSDIPAFRAIAGSVGRFWPVGDASACGRELVAGLETAARAETRAKSLHHFQSKLSWSAVGDAAMTAYAAIDRNA